MSNLKIEKFTLRSATTQDAPALSVLVNSAYRGDSSRKGWTTEADLLGGQRTDPECLTQMILDPNQVILVLADRQQLWGCVNLQRKKDFAYLGMLTVAPTAQASGLGKKILAEAEKWALENWGINRVRLTVIQKREELKKWYLRRGYRLTGERQEFPYGDAKFGEPTSSDLFFEVFEKELTTN